MAEPSVTDVRATVDLGSVERSTTAAALIDHRRRFAAVSRGLCDLLLADREDLTGLDAAQVFRADAGEWSETGVLSLVRADKVALPVRIHAVDIGAGMRLVVVDDVSEQQRRLGDLSFRVGHEPSSRLPNRRAAIERVAGWVDDGEPVALIVVELSRLAPLTTLLGDELVGALVGVAARRVEQVGDGREVVAHVGPARLLVASPGLDDDEDLLDLAVAIVDAIGATLELGASSFRTSTAAGVTVVWPGDSIETGIREATLAMSHAQAQRTEPLRFEPGMRDAERRKLLVELELQAALAAGALELHLQPLVDALTGEVESFEALARWRHPQLGDVSPAEFIAVAEQNGLTRAIGEWCVREVLAEVEAVRAAGGTVRPIAINLSPTQLLDASFIDLLLSAVEEHAAWDAVAVEVTEGVLVSEGAIEALHQLAERGISVAIDDFGTGFSALNYLADVPATTIKIDRSFVARLWQPRTSVLVGGIIAVAHALGLRVVAEGVESADRLGELRGLGCDSIQGYLTGRPAAARTWLALDDPGTVAGAAERDVVPNGEDR